MLEINDSEIRPLCLEHNFWTWSAQAHVNPIAVKKAEGVYFWDVDGNRYLDFNSIVMCVNIGHGNQHVIDAICRQASELSYAGPAMATKPRAVLGKMLCDITPEGIDHFLYTTGGADANENAIKLARAYTGRNTILTYYRSYHGATGGAIALTGDPRRLPWGPTLMPCVVHMVNPYQYRSPFHQHQEEITEEQFSQDYLNYLEDLVLFEGTDKIAAILLEPVTGKNGVIIPPKGYLQGVRAICDKYGILLIADEVMTGFGRTGEWFAVNHWDVKPDLITMAKGLTSAYAPLGAVGIKHEIASAFDERPFYGGLTYNGHPVSLAAAIANIEIIQSENLIHRSAQMGQVLSSQLKILKEKHPCVGDVRSIGLFGIIELVRDRQTKEPLAPYNASSPEMKAIGQSIFKDHVYATTHWHTIVMAPPLIISEEQLLEGIRAIDRALLIGDKAVSG